MRAFHYYNPTEIFFGSGRIADLPKLAARYGTSVLLVTCRENPADPGLPLQVKGELQAAGLTVAHCDGVGQKATADVVSEGAALAKKARVQVVVGLGSVSAIDAAKAIAVEAAHPGTAWDYLFNKQPPTEATLPLVAVPTAGGGSQTTPRALLNKGTVPSAIWNNNLFAKAALVDPGLTVGLPSKATASSGFEAFSRLFEAYTAQAATAYSDMLALEGMRQIVRWLPEVVSDPKREAGREPLAWADTVSGLAISHAGVTLPHSLGMAIGGHCPEVSLGEALASIYPEVLRFTHRHAEAKFAVVSRLLNPTLAGATDAEAAQACAAEVVRFLGAIGLSVSLKSLGVTKASLAVITQTSLELPYFRYNPRVATPEELEGLLRESFER